MPHAARPVLLASLAAALLPAAIASAVDLDWVDVGAPGNACESQSQGCFGAVDTAFAISETEVTNAQYAAFLNAVAASDANGLYHPSMANDGSGWGGIDRSGHEGSYAYAASAGREAMPVNYVSFYDALRFANWLHNGQPSGAQGPATTEDGSYTITAGGIAANTIGRNAAATHVLPSEDEWYKAAYYDPVAQGYLDHPAHDDLPPACAEPTAGLNRANCANAIGAGSGDVTAVGSYPDSASAHGTRDQGGNLWEWNESIVDGGSRGLRGGGFNGGADLLAASHRSLDDPQAEANHVGFRVAVVPEPDGVVLLVAGALGLALLPRSRAARSSSNFRLP
jgi:formylglycine-generating enzyme required for sulfatase activity